MMRQLLASSAHLSICFHKLCECRLLWGNVGGHTVCTEPVDFILNSHALSSGPFVAIPQWHDLSLHSNRSRSPQLGLFGPAKRCFPEMKNFHVCVPGLPEGVFSFLDGCTTKLQVLNVLGCQVLEHSLHRIAAQLTSLPALTALLFGGNRVLSKPRALTDSTSGVAALLKQLPRLPALQRLVMRSVYITQDEAKLLATVTQLEHIEDTEHSAGWHAVALPQLTALTALCLHMQAAQYAAGHNSISPPKFDAGLALAPLTRLQKLHLHDHFNHICGVLAAMPALKDISLHFLFDDIDCSEFVS